MAKWDTTRMSVRFKRFEIRECFGVNKKHARYEIVKWSEEPLEMYCWVIAFIRWNEREPCWELDCVGMRFVDDYEEGLCEFIRRFMKFIGTDFVGSEEG